jgi:HAD superfamily hydrolase (TIGR01459 family)
VKILDGVAPLADRYDGFILDIWGVLHDGKKPYAGVAEALGTLKARGKRIALLSNAPRRSHVVDAMLTGMGLDRALWDATITSGELAWRAMADPARFGRRAFFIGMPDRDLSVIEQLDITLVDDPAEADFILNTGPEPVRGRDTVEPYRATLAACAARGLPMLCANPDRFVMVGEAHVVCAGALADLYLHGKLLYAWVLEKWARRRCGDGWNRLDGPRRATPWRVWKLLRQELATAISGVRHWNLDRWPACLAVMQERPRRRQLQTLPDRVNRLIAQCQALGMSNI